MLEITLTDEERERLGDRLERLDAPSPYEDIERHLLALYPIFASLPGRLLQAVLEFGRFNASPGVLLLRNLPIDDPMPDTPSSGGRASGKPTLVSEGTLLGVAQLIGQVAGYMTEKRGELIHNVIPDPSGTYTQSNKGSGAFLNFHNDLTFDVDKKFYLTNPDFLILLCLRSDRDREAVTYYVHANDLERKLPPRACGLLRQPEYRFSSPHTFTEENQGKRVWSEPLPILEGPAGAAEIRLAANGMEATNPEAAQALAELYEACKDPEVQHASRLQPGDMLLLNNRKGLHARSKFNAKFDGQERWLQRVYIRKSLWELRASATGAPRVFR